ncbi:putative anthocyanin 6''-O-malonyltransferase [Helianthus annuus]|nr:putative anthocyanin 6''-O-malonyltransferase [Helianthus annuus]
MASLPVLTVLDQPLVSPPPATVSDTSLPLTFFDIFYLRAPPIHFLFFYDLPLSTTQFTDTLVPNLKHSLSITLQHFFPYASNLIVFPDRTRKPEIRYVEGDSVKVTFAECTLDFHDLTGYHPRDCDKFYHLIPLLGDCSKISNYVKIPVFSLQVTIFPNCGISIGMSLHHCLVDATTQFSFLKAWTSIARCGTDESLLANGTFPIYERLVKYPELDEIYLKRAKLEAFNEDYQLPQLSGPTDKVRATFVLNRTFINQLKKFVTNKLPTLPYVSSFTVACAYTWCCLAKSRNDDRQAFAIPLDCRTRMDQPIPAAYFGNCIWGCVVIAKTTLLTDKEGFITAAKLIGENLHKMLTDKDGVVKDKLPLEVMLSDGIPTAIISIAGTPKLKLYDIDFGWGKPKKLERISLDYGASISIDAGKESDQDLEIGVCLTATQMQDFVRVFNLGLEPYI